MNVCAELSEVILACESAYESDMYKVDSLIKVADMQRQCAINDADLAYMKEAAEEEIDAMYESANEKFVEKVKAAANKAKEAVKKFFADLIAKVKSLHASIAQKISKLNVKNPFVSRRKVDAPNKRVIKDVQKAYEKFQNALNKLALRAAAGDDIDSADVSEIYSDFNKEFEAAMKSEQMTVAECVAYAQKATEEASSVLSKIEAGSASAMDEVAKRSEKADSPDKASIFSQIISAISRAAQKAGSAIASIPGKVAGAVGKGVDKNAKDEAPVEESVEDTQDTAEELTEESAIDDLEKIFSLDLEELLKGE